MVAAVEKPDEKVYCPISKKPLRLKDLVAVKFTPLERSADAAGKVAASPAVPCSNFPTAVVSSSHSPTLFIFGRRSLVVVVERMLRAGDGAQPALGVPREQEDARQRRRGGRPAQVGPCHLQGRIRLGNQKGVPPTPAPSGIPLGFRAAPSPADPRLAAQDMRDPFSGELLKDKDVIALQRGSSGFAGGGASLEAKTYNPTMRT